MHSFSDATGTSYENVTDPRSYRREKYLGILERVREAMPDAAITTDIIVGFPGETDADFSQTLEVVEQARFASAFTFQYSKRPGTPAAEIPDQIEPAVAINKEIDLRFVLGHTPLEYRDTVHMIAEGKVNCAPMITGVVGLEGVDNAFSALKDPERHAKILIDPKSAARTPEAVRA